MKIKSVWHTNDKRKKRAIGGELLTFQGWRFYDPDEIISAEWDRENVESETVKRESKVKKDDL